MQTQHLHLEASRSPEALTARAGVPQVEASSGDPLASAVSEPDPKAGSGIATSRQEPEVALAKPHEGTAAGPGSPRLCTKPVPSPTRCSSMLQKRQNSEQKPNLIPAPREPLAVFTCYLVTTPNHNGTARAPGWPQRGVRDLERTIDP